MKWIAPDYYSSFRCAASACRHTCCAGWEIGIDEETAEYYRTLPEPWRERLLSRIEEADGEYCFRLTADGRCPFLQPSGLCELILSLGEEALCQTCADHPRFRSFFSDRTELGLGLCCEEAGRRILTRKEKLRLQCLADDGEAEKETDAEAAVLALREKWILQAQERELPVSERALRLAEDCAQALPAFSEKEISFLLSLERLEDSWRVRLEALRDPALSEMPRQTPETELALEQLLVYLLYRHVPDAENAEEAKDRARFALYLWCLACRLFAASETKNGTLSAEETVEICRQLSSEIEYSDCNPAAIRAHLLTEKEGCLTITQTEK